MKVTNSKADKTIVERSNKKRRLPDYPTIDGYYLIPIHRRRRLEHLSTKQRMSLELFYREKGKTLTLGRHESNG
jgi:hypothetical protein